MIRKIYAISTLLLCFFNLPAQKIFYVSQNGNDLNPGTEEQHLASLIGARDAIRQYKKRHSLKDSIVVLIADGMYEMKEPFILRPEDSGTQDFPVIYKAAKGANPVFSGGRIISGFSVNENGIWEANIHESKYYKWRFHQLYVNQKRARLARTPNSGFLNIADIQQNVWVQGTGRAPDKAQQIIKLDANDFKALQNISTEDLDLIRFRTFHHWDFTMRHIDKIDKDSLTIYTSGAGMKPWNSIKKNGRLFFENYAAALDAAGEWFLNDKGTLYYFPLPGETPENSIVVAPVLENLVSLKGNLKTNKVVEHIKFVGLTFRHSHYAIPPSGFEPNQAATAINASIILEGAKNITFSACEISLTGQHALWFRKGSSHSIVEHCTLKNIGGGGVYLGDVSQVDGVPHTKNIKLYNNIIQSGGREFPPAVGVWIGHSSDNEVRHNDIADFYYTGVSVGWVWGYNPSVSKRNNISFNHIHHIGWDLLSDMAAVYTLGKSEGTIINNNVVHHIHSYSYGGWGLYTDEGSSDIVMKNNLVYSTKTGGFHQHYGENNIIQNNIFAYAKLYQAQATRVENHRSFNFTNNIIVFDKGYVLKGPWTKIDIGMDNNLYWNTHGNTYNFNNASFVDWQKSGYDKNSLIINPNFIDAPKFDFRFKNNNNSSKIGFIPFDYSKSGLYGNKEWIEKAKLPKNTLEEFDKAVNGNIQNFPLD